MVAAALPVVDARATAQVEHRQLPRDPARFAGMLRRGSERTGEASCEREVEIRQARELRITQPIGVRTEARAPASPEIAPERGLPLDVQARLPVPGGRGGVRARAAVPERR